MVVKWTVTQDESRKCYVNDQIFPSTPSAALNFRQPAMAPAAGLALPGTPLRALPAQLPSLKNWIQVQRRSKQSFAVADYGVLS